MAGDFDRAVDDVQVRTIRIVTVDQQAIVERRRRQPEAVGVAIGVEQRDDGFDGLSVVVGHRRGAAQAKQSGVRIVPVIFGQRSEEHTSELQSLMRISYAVFCLKKKKKEIT